MTTEHRDSVEMPKATVWPMVLGLGVVLLGAGVATTTLFFLVGGAVFLIGLTGWIGQLLGGRGHGHEAMVEPARRPRAIVGVPGSVQTLRPDMPGYRLRLPEKVHPISAGVKGGIVGGLLMPIPAVAYGVLSGHGIWFPVNLLAGMVLPGIDDMTVAELEQFRLSLLLLGIAIHAFNSVVIGLMYGVLLPALPPIPGGPLVWGGLLMPMLWTGASFGLMGVINPVLGEHVEWRWFLLSQFVYGLAASIVVILSEQVHIAPAGTGPEAEHGHMVER